MRIVLPSILLLVLLGSLGASSAKFQDNDTRPPSKAELELTSLLVERKYCSDGLMLLVLQFQYRNIGKERLILLRHAMAPSEYMISRTMADANARRYEKVISPTLGTSPSLVQFSDDPPSEHFVVLEPGESFKPVNTATVPLFITNADKENSKEYLGPGEHLLELKVSMWPFDNNLQADLRSRWQRLGTLWSKPLLSLPMSFQIDRSRDRSLSDCNSPARTEK